MSGPTALIFYKTILIKFNFMRALALYEQKRDVTSALFSYTTTMLGFLIALFSLLITITSSKVFIDYKEKGYLKKFYILYTLTILSLVVMAFILLLNFSAGDTSFIFNLSIMLFINSLVHVSIITWTISRLLIRAI